MEKLIYYQFFHLYSLNKDISVTMYVIDLICYVCILNIPFEGTVSQLFYLGPIFFFIFFFLLTFCHFLESKFLHFIKLKLVPKSKF